jgi:leucyl-tRNA synthetase
MTQWSMRISAYAERLLQGLNDIDWSSIKESQKLDWKISWCDCRI